MGNRQDIQDGAPTNDLATYQALINMGFSEDLSLLAAKKYPKHIMNAIDWIGKQEKSTEHLKQKIHRQSVVYGGYDDDVNDDSNTETPRGPPPAEDVTNDAKEQKEAPNLDANINIMKNATFLNECSGDSCCSSVKRIIKILKYYDEQPYDNEDEESVNKLNKFLESNDALYLINDYHHILDQHLDQDKNTKSFVDGQFKAIYTEMMNQENDLKCQVNSCKIFARNNRSREMEIVTKSHDINKELSFFIDLLDSIHCYFIHSVDCGYRVIDNIYNDDKKMNNDSNIDVELKGLKSYMIDKCVLLQSVRSEDRIINNRFVSNITFTETINDDPEVNDGPEIKEDDGDFIDDDAIEDWLTQTIDLNEQEIKQYSQLLVESGYNTLSSLQNITQQTLDEIGISNKEHQNMIILELQTTAGSPRVVDEDQKEESYTNKGPADIINDKQDGYGYTVGKRYDYWGTYGQSINTVQQCKYDSIKMEVTCNSIYSVPIDAFDEAYKKATELIQGSEILKAMQSTKENLYKMKAGEKLGIFNILALVLYCDYDTLSYHFTKTFRPNPDPQSIEEAARRNREFFNWSKILIETVNCFGTDYNEKSTLQSLYHSTSFGYFTSFSILFNAPTSTTTQLSVATMFAENNGVILELGASQGLKYFNCSFISCFGFEDQRLFVQPINFDNPPRLQIASLRNMETCEKYKGCIRSLADFEKLVNGQRVTINGQSLVVMEKLFGAQNDYPEYINQCFKQWTDKYQQIMIDYRDLPKLFRSNTDKLPSIYTINKYFPNIELIEISGIFDEIKEWFQYLGAIRRMLDIINNDSNCSLKEICFIDIGHDSLDLEQYKSVITNAKWNIGFKQKQNELQQHSLMLRLWRDIN